MLNTKQQKKSNNNIRYSLGHNPPSAHIITGKPVKKNRPLKDKLHKNLSTQYRYEGQIPIVLLNQSKQNVALSNLMLPRPHSSLVGSDVSRSLSKSKQRVDINSFCKDKIKFNKISSKRNTLAIGQSRIKPRRPSGTSHSQKKWNNKSVEEDPQMIKQIMAQNRKKYNLSCGDMISSPSKMKQVQQKNKKKSLLGATKNNTKTKSKKTIKKQLKEPENIKIFKPMNIGNKSKGSTTVINQNVSAKNKRKEKDNKENKKKVQRSKSKSKSKNKNKKSNKMFVIPKDDSDQEKQKQDPQYPVNKYVNMKKKHKNDLNIKVGPNYNFSGINIASGSSATLCDLQRENFSSKQQNKNQKLRNSVYEYQPSDSLNLEQIKYYEEHSPIKNRSQQFVKLKNKLRKQIVIELEEQYPYLNSTQLKFLSCIVLIQRKWKELRLHRHLSKKQQIITEYIVEQLQESRENKNRQNKISAELSRLGQKTKLMSRTKFAEFSANQQTFAKSSHEQIDPHDYETRKNSKKDSLFIYQQQNQSQKQSRVNEGTEENLTERRPRTESGIIAINYSWIFSRQIFPQITYLEYRKNALRQEFEKTITSLNSEKINKEITQKEFQKKKNTVIKDYEKAITSLKKTKHDIKKGYLKYIECINKVKQIKNSHDHENKAGNHQYGLRKVSSQSNFLSNLYEKLFKFDKCISQWSGGSESIQMLAKKILIRKEFIKGGKTNSERRSLSDLRSVPRSSLQMIKSCRQSDSNTVVVFQYTDRLTNLQFSELNNKNSSQRDSQLRVVKQFKFSSQIFKGGQENKLCEQEFGQINQKQAEKEPKLCVYNIQKTSINALANSVSLLLGGEQVESKVEDLIVTQLAKQFQRDIHKINPILMDMILINQPSISQYEGVQYQQFDEEQSSPALQSLHRQFQSMGSPRQVPVRDYFSSETDPEQIVMYISELVQFIISKNWSESIVYNMNNNQTFEPLSYLKFLRDFEIPQDEYIPIISNQKFIEWETFYNGRLEAKHGNQGSSCFDNQIIKQSQTIFHRCVFQVFLGELQKNRPYGERGRPFPWQQKYSYLTVRQIAPDQLVQLFRRSLNKIEQYLIYKCGLISQKLFIVNEDELERAHEQNEDRIIQMLEQDLIETNHQWYQLEQHALQIKLQVTYLIQDQLIDQIIRTIAV